jgi:hypothetical protein
MRTALVGPTGRIGVKLNDNRLAKRHQSKLFREEGPDLTHLSRKEPNRSLASFDIGTG